MKEAPIQWKKRKKERAFQRLLGKNPRLGKLFVLNATKVWVEAGYVI
jgi:hypothetical protein